MRLLGLDPGLRITGWGVLDQRDNRLIWVADGTVTSDEKLSLAERLAQLYRGVTEDASDALAVAICHAHHRKHAAMMLKIAVGR